MCFPNSIFCELYNHIFFEISEHISRYQIRLGQKFPGDSSQADDILDFPCNIEAVGTGQGA